MANGLTCLHTDVAIFFRQLDNMSVRRAVISARWCGQLYKEWETKTISVAEENNVSSCWLVAKISSEWPWPSISNDWWIIEIKGFHWLFHRLAFNWSIIGRWCHMCILSSRVADKVINKFEYHNGWIKGTRSGQETLLTWIELTHHKPYIGLQLVRKRRVTYWA